MAAKYINIYIHFSLSLFIFSPQPGFGAYLYDGFTNSWSYPKMALLFLLLLLLFYRSFEISPGRVRADQTHARTSAEMWRHLHAPTSSDPDLYNKYSKKKQGKKRKLGLIGIDWDWCWLMLIDLKVTEGAGELLFDVKERRGGRLSGRGGRQTGKWIAPQQIRAERKWKRKRKSIHGQWRHWNARRRAVTTQRLQQINSTSFLFHSHFILIQFQFHSNFIPISFQFHSNSILI